jgi:hypothetical protein
MTQKLKPKFIGRNSIWGQGHDTDISGLGPADLLIYINEIELGKIEALVVE